MIGVNEKYLYEFNNMNPFYSLLFEGFFGLLFSLVYDLCNDSSKKINEFIKNKTSSEFAILIFCLIIYIILSGLKNLYRVNITKIFTPMTTSAFDFFLIPIDNIIYFIKAEEFITKGEKNYVNFFINFIINLSIFFLSLVFNEFIILFFCDLNKDTHLQITMRAALEENSINLEDINNGDNNDDEN